MKLRKSLCLSIIVFSLLFIFGAMTVQAQGRNRAQDFQRFSLTLGGGMGSSEGHQGLMDLAAEFQFGFSPRLRLGLGVGYLNNLHGGRGDMNRGNDHMDAQQTMDQSWGWLFGGNDRNDGLNGSTTQVRVVPVSLNLYYLVPVGRKWDVFAAGGASYNFGFFRDGTPSEHKRAFGGQAGMGVEFRLADRLKLVAEGGYRFLRFRNLRRPEVATDSWVQFLSDWQDFIKSLIGGTIDLSPQTQEKNYNLNLSGFTCRLGVKFGF